MRLTSLAAGILTLAVAGFLALLGSISGAPRPRSSSALPASPPFASSCSGRKTISSSLPNRRRP